MRRTRIAARRDTRRALALVLALWALYPSELRAQAPAPAPSPAPNPLPYGIPPLTFAGPYDSTFRVELYDRLRGEIVDWFGTPQDGPTKDFRYNFIGNKFQLGLRWNLDPYEAFVQFQDSTLGDVPDMGIGIGQTYYLNTRSVTQNGAFLRQGWASVKNLFGSGVSVKGGRQLYLNGAEFAPTAPNLKWIQAWRIGQRLLGPFDYTHVGRSFDGGQIAWDNSFLNVTGFGFIPTYGGFEVDAMRELDITLGGLSLNLKDAPEVGPMIGNLFWIYYGDDRDVLFVDNRPLPVREADRGKPANLHTVGANLVRLFPAGPGLIDTFAYGYGQFGDYQSLDQLAWAYGVEAGYRLMEVPSKPWMRLGINSGSGDTDPLDDDHGTFFQMLPTAWLYAQFPFYNMMNNQDVFVQTILEPHPMFSARFDFHWLMLNASQDLAYFGGGATKNDFFGFGGVNGNGRNQLAYLAHMMLTARPTANLTLNAFYAHAWGQGVINQAFVGRDANYCFLEATVAF
jgi:hypothetical protein